MRPRQLKTDILAQALIPCDVPKNLIACEVVGDGNCLYKECFNILWSSDGGLDSDPKAIYIPNHFVPLFEKEQEDRLKQKTTSAKLSIGS